MTEDTTTIQITKRQKAELDDRKRNDREAYKSVLDRVLRNSEDSGGLVDESQAERIAEQVVERKVRELR